MNELEELAIELENLISKAGYSIDMSDIKDVLNHELEPSTSEPACERYVDHFQPETNEGSLDRWFAEECRQQAEEEAIERERLRQKALLTLALEALGKGEMELVERCVNKIGGQPCSQ